ncbi:succinate dehydrogenase assembly factor 4, mitochondrial-like [Daphnia carinata]|uniref:succinate dehydrogenase assembly factor 4, mitochondrial-like n=1 Tax=Daphnia carinata TaxID=120202 RepID=UPI00257CC1EA|nr:succinate dehydrogenase assembly factor 4, mitochondrial-like [Daphnia carinata]
MNPGTSSICVLKSLLRQTARRHHVSFFSTSTTDPSNGCASKATKKRVKTPIGKLDEIEEGQHPYQEKEPLKPHPNNTNPATGEVGGPKGPEPTRYGDWERKGRVSDF